MVRIEVKDGGIYVVLENTAAFTTIVAILKQYRCMFSAKTKKWKINLKDYDKVCEKIEEWDTVYKPEESEILNLLSGTPELKVVPTRVQYNWNILTSKPLVGKHPFEDFQKIDITAGISRNRYAYFLGMGTGKAYIASALIAHHHKHGPVSKVVLLTSTIGVNNLYYEIIRFVKGLDPSRVQIVNKKNRACFEDKSIDVLVMNYVTWRLVCNHYKKSKAALPEKPWLPIAEWSGNKPCMLLLDEAHCVNNPNSQQGGFMAVNSQLFEYRYHFTGTPADTPEKLYNLYKILDPYLVHRLSFGQWKGVYAELGNGFSDSAIVGWKREKLEQLNKLFTSRYGVYRATEDILELPENYMKKIRVTMSPKHRTLYEALTVKSFERLTKYSPHDIVGSIFPYAMMALENPELLTKHKEKFGDDIQEKIDRFNCSADLSKLEILDEIVSDYQKGQKGVIWCVHPKTVELLCERYKKLNPLYVHGEVANEERFELVKQFNASNDHQLMIAVVSTLNTSISMTTASWQCYVERPANYTEYNQSMYRVYRNGQTKNITTYELVYEKSLEMFRDADLQSKGQLVSGLASKDFISMDVWKQIFSYNKDSDEDFNFGDAVG